MFAAINSVFNPTDCFDIGGFNPADPTQTYVSLAILDSGTVIYYDHWEDTYERDVQNQLQATSEIWGDGDPTNGFPPGFPTDNLNQGDVIILNNSVVSTTTQTVIDFDGKDRIDATSPIAVTRTGWASGSDTLLAGALELYPTFLWGTAYTVPAGEDLGNEFGTTGAAIIAAEDGTVVSIDLDGDGTVDVTATLDQGESFHQDGGLQTGATITSSGPVQVQLLTGQVCSTFSARWFSIRPDTDFTDSYMIPVSSPTNDPTTAFVHNPTNGPIDVRYENEFGVVSTTTIAAGATAEIDMVNGTAGRLFTVNASAGTPFTLLVAIDSNNGTDGDGITHDWGFQPLPELQLLQQLAVGWGAPQDPTQPFSENSAPVWITASFPQGSSSTGTIDLCVDYDGDRVGPLTDANGLNYDERITINPLEQEIIYDPDNDQTGMVIYVCDGSDAILSGAWGQDPNTASPGAPAIDTGTSIIPIQRYFSTKDFSFSNDVNGNGAVNPGDTITFEIDIQALGVLPVPGLVITLSDILPAEFQYVANSTQVDDGSGTTSIPDDGTGTAFPLDGSGFLIPTTIPVDGNVLITFDALVGAAPAGDCTVTNVATASGADGEFSPTRPVCIEDPQLVLEKSTEGLDADTPTGPEISVGDTVTWVYAISNPGNTFFFNVSLTDDQEGPIVIPPVGSIVGDSNNDGFLDVGETWLITHTGTAGSGQYANIGTVEATTASGVDLSDTDPSHYFGLSPDIGLEKLTNGVDADIPTGPQIALGDTVTWVYEITNSGNANLTNISLVDDQEGVISIPPAGSIAGDDGDGIFEPGETWAITHTGTVSATGQYSNIGSVSAEDSQGTSVNASDPSNYFGINPSLALEKLTNGVDHDTATGPQLALGETVTWTYQITNDGDVDLTSVILTDDQEGAIAIPAAGSITGDDGDGVLEPGETWEITHTGTVVAAGQYANIGTVEAEDPNGDTVEDTDPSHYFGINPELTLEKLTNGVDADTPTGPQIPVGNTVTWTYQITNSGDVDLSSVTLTDDQEGSIAIPAAGSISGDDGDGVLEPGETWSVTHTGSATIGQYANLGTVTAEDPNGDPVDDTDPSHYFGIDPSLVLEKLTDGVDADTPTGPQLALGDTVTWTYQITNDGDVDLTNVSLTDDQEGVITIPAAGSITGDDGDGVLQPGETWSITHTGTVAAIGQYANIGTANAEDPNGDPVNDTDPSHYFGIDPGVVLQKSTNGVDADTPTGPQIAVGDTVTWVYDIQNSGDVDLTNVTLTDDQEGVITIPAAGSIPGDDGDGVLEPGETWSITHTGSATAGQYANIGTVGAEDPNGDPVGDTDPSHYLGINPEVTLEKLTNGVDADTPTGPQIALGDTVTWTYQITNSGDANLTNVSLTDDQEGVIAIPAAGSIPGDDGDGILEPGETWSVTQTGTATAAGQYANIGTVGAEDPNGDPVSDTDPSHYFGIDPSLTLEKLTDGIDADTPTGPQLALGDTVTWTYQITNDGDVDLSRVTLVDDQEGPIAIPAAGSISGDDGDGILQVGETWEITHTGTVTAAGQYANIGTATAEDPNGDPVNDTDPSHYFGIDPSVTLEKLTNGVDADSPTGPQIALGDTVTWTYQITNDGSVDLTNVSLSDDQEGVIAIPAAGSIPGDDGDGVLEPGETWIVTHTGTVASAGQYANIGTVGAEDPNGDPVADTDPSHYFGIDPSLTLEKLTEGVDADTPTGPQLALGDTVTWTYQITNDGDVDLSSVTLVDDQEGPIAIPAAGSITGDDGDGVLQPGETWSIIHTGTVTATGQYANIGTANAEDPNGEPVNDTDPSHYFGIDPGIVLQKSTNGVDADTPTGPQIAVGDTVTWVYDIQNSGDVDLTNVVLTDDQEGIITIPVAGSIAGDDGDGVLEPGETWNISHTGTATAGQYANIGTVGAEDPNGNPVGDTDPSHYLGINPEVTLEKLTNGLDADTPTGPQIALGDTVTWTYQITNSGDVDLANVTLTDDQEGIVTVPAAGSITGDDGDGVLEPGETWSVIHTGTATAAGQYANIGTVGAEDPNGDPVSDTDPSHYFGIDPSLRLEKLTDGVDADTPTGPQLALGDTVTWTYQITNDGDVDLSNVRLVDDQEGAITIPAAGSIIGDDGDGVLQVGETWEITHTGTVTAAGQYANIGTANAEDPNGDSVNDTDPSHYFGIDPQVVLQKSTNGVDADTPTGPQIALGDTVTWVYDIQNSGDVDLTNVTLTDDQEGVIAIPAAGSIPGDDGDGILEPGETWSITHTGTATASGQYANIGTVGAEDPNGDPVGDTDPSHYLGIDPEVTLEKLTNGVDADTPTGPQIALGDTVTWTYQITNSGDADLTNVSLTDDQEGTIAIPAAGSISGDDGDGILEPGETWSITHTGTATAAGQYANIGTVGAEDPNGDPVGDTDPSHYFGIDPSLTLEKLTEGVDADTPTGPQIALGSTVTWTYQITNDGDVDLTNVTLTDDQEGVIAIPAVGSIAGDDGDGVLQVGETWEITHNGTVTAAGQYANIGTANAEDPNGDSVSDTDPSHYFGIDPGVVLQKSTNGVDADTPTGPQIAVGDTVTWVYDIQNSGDVDLTNVTLTDDQEGVITIPAAGSIPGDDGDGILEPGETWSITHTGTAAAGQYANLGTVGAEDPNGEPVEDTDPSHYLGIDPEVTLEKLTNGVDADIATGPQIALGDTVTWTYQITNSGDADLTNVSLTDDQEGVIAIPAAGSITGDDGDGVLEPGETWSVTQTGTATAAGQYANIGTVGGEDPNGDPVSDTDPSHYFGIDPSLTLEKLTDGVDADTPTGPQLALGDTVTWTYQITNDGDVDLSNVRLVDDQEGVITIPAAGSIPGDDGDGVLQVGESWSITHTGTVTATGQYTNIGTAIAEDPNGDPVNDTDPSHYFGIDPGVVLQKSTNGVDADLPTGPQIAVGDTVTWVYDIQNSGDVDLTNITLTDDQEGVIAIPAAGSIPGDDGDGVLESGETWSITHTSTVTTVGQYANVGTVAAEDPNGDPVGDTDPSHYFGIEPGLVLEKLTNGLDADTATGPQIALGDTVTWTYQITNSGDVDLTNVSLTDDQEGVITIPTAGSIVGDDGDGILEPGENWSITHTGTVITAGQYTNIGTVSAEDPNGDAVSDTDPSNYIGIDPSLALEKLTDGIDADTPTGPQIVIGDTVTWTYQLTNDGDVDLTNISLADDQEGVIAIPTAGSIPGDDGDGILEPGETWSIVHTATVTTSGQYANIGTASAEDPIGGSVSDTDPSHYFGINPSVALEKLTNGVDADSPTGPQIVVGDTVTWTYQITNDGDVDLANVALTDDQEGSIAIPAAGSIAGDDGDGVLQVGETWSIVHTGAASTGQYSNIGTVSGNDPNGDSVSDTDPSHYFGINPGIELEKLTNGSDSDIAPGNLISLGSTVVWTYQLTNTGDVPLSNLSLTDDQEGPIAIPAAGSIAGDDGNGILDVGEVWSIQHAGTVSSVGLYSNLGSISAEDPTGAPVGDSDPSNYTGFDPGIVLQKLTNGVDADVPTGPQVVVGDTITWTYAVENTGGVNLTNVTIVDNVEGPIAIPAAGSIVGDDGDGVLEPGETWIITHTGVATSGQYANIGTVTAEDPVGGSVNDDDPSHYLGINPRLELEKLTNGLDSDTAPGETLVVGEPVIWTYLLSNTGDVPLTNVSVSDDQEGVIAIPAAGSIVGDDGDGILQPGETWELTQSGVAVAGSYTNTGTVIAEDSNGDPVSDSDPSNYTGETPGIELEKHTNGLDADTTGPLLLVGDSVTWTYFVSNTGGIDLTNVAITDDQEGVISIPAAGSIAGDNGDGVLQPGETWIITQSGVAVAGNYTNIGTVTAEDTAGGTVTDLDPSNYEGLIGDLIIEKSTNGIDSDNAPGEILTAGDPVVWTYVVTNTFSVPLSNINVSDSQGVRVNFVSGDINLDGNLDPSETWVYEGNGLVVEGPYMNMGTVTAELPDGGPLSDEDPSHYTGDPGFEPASLGSFVWFDTNQDGILDPGEQPFPGVTVNLFDSFGNLVGTQTTGSDGAWLFTGLTPDDYVVEFLTPPGFLLTTQDSGTDNGLDSDADPLSGFTAPITLGSGENNLSVFAGVFMDNPLCIDHSLEGPVRLIWNTFLEQINVISVINSCEAADTVTLTVYDIDGNQVDQVMTSLAGNATRDFIVNDFNGVGVDTYGFLDVSFSNPGCAQGYQSFYRLGDELLNSGAPEIEFQIKLPFKGGITGPGYLTFNTIHPAGDADAIVPNWLQVTNLDATVAKTFTSNLYDLAGNLIESTTFTVPPLGRQDVQAGHENPGPGFTGMVEVIPSDPSAEYIAQLFRYGIPDPADLSTFDFAMGFQATSGKTGCQMVNVSAGGGGQNWLVVANAESSVQSLTVEITDIFGATPIASIPVNLAGNAQEHIFVSQFLPDGASGIATVCSDLEQDFITENNVYFNGSSGLCSAYGTQGRPGQCADGHSGFNTFWNQTNWVRLTTPENFQVDVEIRVFDMFGNLIASFPAWLAPGTGTDFNLSEPPFSVPADTIGTVEVVHNSSTPGAVLVEVVQVGEPTQECEGFSSAVAIPVKQVE